MRIHPQDYQTPWHCWSSPLHPTVFKGDSPGISEVNDVTDTDLAPERTSKDSLSDESDATDTSLIHEHSSEDAVHEFHDNDFRNRFLQHNHLVHSLYLFLNSQRPGIANNIHFIVNSVDYSLHIFNRYAFVSSLVGDAKHPEEDGENFAASLVTMSEQLIPVPQTFSQYAVGEKNPVKQRISRVAKYCDVYPRYFESEKVCYGAENVYIYSLCEMPDVSFIASYPASCYLDISPILIRYRAKLQDLFLKSLDASGGMNWLSQHILSEGGVITPSINFVLPNEEEKAKYGNKAKIYTFPSKILVTSKKSSPTPVIPTVQKSIGNRSDTYPERIKPLSVREPSPKYELNASLHLEADIPFSEDIPLLNTYFSQPVSENFTERSDTSHLQDDLLNHVQEHLSNTSRNTPLSEHKIIKEIQRATNEWSQKIQERFFDERMVHGLQESIHQNLPNVSRELLHQLTDDANQTIQKHLFNVDLSGEETSAPKEIDPKLKRKWERMCLGTVDSETGLYLPLPHEVPEEWKWHRPMDWKQMTPDQRDKSLREYLLNPEGFGKFLKAEIFYQDQLAALDERGISEFRNFYKNYKDISELADIIPIKSNRTKKETMNPANIKRTAHYNSLEYHRKKKNELNYKKASLK